MDLVDSLLPVPLLASLWEPKLTRREFELHEEIEEGRFNTLRGELAAHSSNVDGKHQENKTKLDSIKTTVDSLAALRPGIEAGFAMEKEREYRRKMIRRVVAAIIATATVVSGLIPILQFFFSHIDVRIM